MHGPASPVALAAVIALAAIAYSLYFIARTLVRMWRGR